MPSHAQTVAIVLAPILIRFLQDSHPQLVAQVLLSFCLLSVAVMTLIYTLHRTHTQYCTFLNHSCSNLFECSVCPYRNLSMCFFEHAVWACGHWQWGPLREQCWVGLSTGEVCRLRLVSSTVFPGVVCHPCDDIQDSVSLLKDLETSQTDVGASIARIQKRIECARRRISVHGCVTLLPSLQMLLYRHQASMDGRWRRTSAIHSRVSSKPEASSRTSFATSERQLAGWSDGQFVCQFRDSHFYQGSEQTRHMSQIHGTVRDQEEAEMTLRQIQPRLM